jgi:uncharacterized sodium:solute symporter family permease YidK
MKRLALIVGVVALLGVILAAIVPMWVATSGIGMSGSGYAAVFLTVLFCFAVGGGLMFLVFYSARKGHDEAVYLGTHRRAEEAEPEKRAD